MKMTPATAMALIKHLSAVLDERTSERITPRLQAFSDASAQVAAARAAQTRWEAVLRQWDAMDFIETVTLTGTSQYILAAVHHAGRRVRILGTTANPTMLG